MCTHITTTQTEIADLFGLTYDLRTPQPQARYNVTPSTFVPVLRTIDGTRELTELRWGLVLHWTPNGRRRPAGYPNARAECDGEARVPRPVAVPTWKQPSLFDEVA